ncbi:MAG: ATP-binding cassette domain-containing protein [Dehalococcoidia bacterium]|nr:ATP-binding cassette domain-containing protein [Dehalococcoidia bacterium]
MELTEQPSEAPAAESPGALAPPPGEAVVIRDLWFAYRGAAPVLHGVDFVARRGQITMILGASGSGKTTLLKLIKGFLRPSRGSLTVLGRTWSAGGPDPQITAATSYIPQNLGLLRNMTVLENVLIGALGRMDTIPSLLRSFPRDMVVEASGVLERLGLGGKDHLKVHTLSGGERQRVAIARARLQRATLLLADEFVSQLDPITKTEVMNILRTRSKEAGTTYVQTTHQLDVVEQFADHVVVLREGKQVLDSPAAGLDVMEIARIIKQ